MGSLDPIAYTYEADYHCEGCAGERFGTDEFGFITGTDSEGNPVGAVFPTDEWYANAIYEHKPYEVLACGTCGGVIDEYRDEDQLEYLERQAELNSVPWYRPFKFFTVLRDLMYDYPNGELTSSWQ